MPSARQQWLIRLKRDSDHALLLRIWEDAVRATHHFLEEHDIALYRAFLESGYLSNEHTIVACPASASDSIAGFLEGENLPFELLLTEGGGYQAPGTRHVYAAPEGHASGRGKQGGGDHALESDKCLFPLCGRNAGKVSMLFVAPEFHGCGAGSALLAYAGEVAPHLHLDVNEQNPGALAFYRKQGFHVAARSALDDQGGPFPLLHLCRNTAPGDPVK